jgi:mono/diheme cytochrome c family protein
MLALVWPQVARLPVALLALVAAFSFLAEHERLREGARKPYVIRDVMFSNGIRAADVPELGRRGILSRARWAAREADGGPVEVGRAVFRAECAACHTLGGYLSIRKRVAGMDPDMVRGVVETLREQARVWDRTAGRPARPATEGLSYPLMPPFVGTVEEMEALVAYLVSLAPAEPASRRAAEAPRGR